MIVMNRFLQLSVLAALALAGPAVAAGKRAPKPAPVSLLVPAAKGYVLTLKVEGVRSDQGQLRAQLLLRKTADGTPETVGFAVEPAKTGAVIMTFRNLPAGDYAVQLYHDENDNGKVDLNLLGIPSEGFGFSNIPQVQGGIPPFERMKVTVAGDAAATAVLAYAP